MQSDSPFRNISIILVETKTPANIGAVCRCMMNAGLSRLILVRPPGDPKGDARRLAAGAEAVLDAAEIFPDLREAVAGHQAVFGASRRSGRQRKNIRTPREMAASALPLLAKNRVAVVFGREVDGLERGDLALCSELVRIPSSDAFPSLNLSHAVMIVAYELFIAQALPAAPEPELAPAEETEDLYRHLEGTLLAIGFLDEVNRERMMFSLRQLFGRARPDRRDVKVLRGILTQVDRTARGHAPRRRP